VREYFELERVREGMFEIFGKLFGISFKKKKTKL
jgi:Zn-dependent oligopeptidase